MTFHIEAKWLGRVDDTPLSGAETVEDCVTLAEIEIGAAGDVGERLRPATNAATYRQKMQRAFAAELLCPIESLLGSLDDLSYEAQQQAAERFKVSPLAVESQLTNNGYLHHPRDLDVAA